MRSRPILLLATGAASLSLAACAPRLVIVEQCPAIPVALTEPCRLPEREITTNGDLARAYVDALECVEESALKLQTVASLAECRATRGKSDARLSR